MVQEIYILILTTNKTHKLRYFPPVKFTIELGTTKSMSYFCMKYVAKSLAELICMEICRACLEQVMTESMYLMKRTVSL